MTRPHPAIAITGIGLASAQGIGVDAAWSNILTGHDALTPLPTWLDLTPASPLARCKVAACPAFERPDDLPPRLWKTLSRTQQLAALAADEALASAKLPRRLNDSRAGMFLATTVCGMDQNERFYAQYRQDPARADDDLMRRLMPWELAEFLARRHRTSSDPALRQVCMTTCVGSAMALANACDALTLGECDTALAAGSESLCRVVLSGFNALKVVAPDGCRPFDLHRPGITVGEGAALLVLERPDHARRRGVQPLAYLRGIGLRCDAYHLTAPDPAATQAIAAIRDALARASLIPADVGYINAHGTGTRDNDAMESRALQAVFGDACPPVSSTKRFTGHTFGAAAAVELILCIQALRTGFLPPNAGSVTPDPALPLPVIRGDALHRQARTALSTNFAFGGNNAATLVSLDGGPHA